jgi:hypothetical protein
LRHLGGVPERATRVGLGVDHVSADDGIARDDALMMSSKMPL